jgi:hypothetical protein
MEMPNGIQRRRHWFSRLLTYLLCEVRYLPTASPHKYMETRSLQDTRTCNPSPLDSDNRPSRGLCGIESLVV